MERASVFEQSIELNGSVTGQYLGFFEVGNHEFIVVSLFLLM